MCLEGTIMRKVSFIIITILLAFLVSLSVMSCNDVTESGYSMALVEDEEYKVKGYFEFTVGEIDWTAVNFIVYDAEGNSIGDAITASQSMVYGDDLYKLNSAGTKTITLHYQGASLQVTFKLNNPIVVQTYTVTFNAGEGYFDDQDTNTNIKTIEASVIEAIPRPIRDGYDFQGWYEDEFYTGISLITPYSLKKDMTYYAKWSDKRKYNVSFAAYKISDDPSVSDILVKNLDGINNVEYGTTIELIQPEAILGYDFVYYEIIDASNNITQIEYDNDIESYSFEVTSNLNIRLCYKIKVFTLTFISEAWKDGDIVNGVEIVGGVYKKQVEYGTELIKNTDPIPALPILEGHSGVWVDMATQKEPLYSIATQDITIVANYTIIQFVMSFTDENGVPFENMDRYVNYGESIETAPPVPTKTGHDGVWTILIGNHYQIVPLETIKMVEDVVVRASYTPKKFDINFHYRLNGMTEDYVETYTYSFGDQIVRPVDLSVEKTINGVSYKGYDSKYYEILWYASSALVTQVSFPRDVVNTADYFYKVVEKPYVVDFRVPADFKDSGIEHETLTVKVGDRVQAPKWNIEGYNIIGWYYTRFAPYFDASVSYKANDVVFYENTYYSAKVDCVGTIPGTDDTCWEVSKDYNREYYTSGAIENGILITDFHEYNEDKYYDRAFYPVYQAKQIPMYFYSLNISLENGKYIYEYELVDGVKNAIYGTVGIDSYAPILTAPTYPGGRDSKFIFDGWYTESDFVTLPVDLSKVVLKDEVVLYAKWTDELVGTEGLIFTPYETGSNGEAVSYQVSGFNSTLAEFSHLIMRIPEYYNGKSVVSIGSYAFADFSKVLFIDEIIIPSTITHIGDNAFAACHGLSKFNVENNSSFRVDDFGVLYSNDSTILYAAALNDTAFAQSYNYTIPSSVVEIAGGAFAGATNLVSINFDGLSYQNGSFVGGVSLETIGSYAFDGCYKLQSISIPNSVTTIGQFAFRNCYALTTIEIDSNNSALYKVGIGAFAGCENALNVVDEKYLMIGNVLVHYLADDEALTLNDSIVAIADGAFDRSIVDEDASNYKLAELYINSSSNLKYIGRKVFLSCSSLNSIHIMKNEKVEIEIDSFDGIALNSKLYVYSNALDLYISDVDYCTCFGEENIVSA